MTALKYILPIFSIILSADLFACANDFEECQILEPGSKAGLFNQGGQVNDIEVFDYVCGEPKSVCVSKPVGLNRTLDVTIILESGNIKTNFTGQFATGVSEDFFVKSTTGLIKFTTGKLSNKDELKNKLVDCLGINLSKKSYFEIGTESSPLEFTISCDKASASLPAPVEENFLLFYESTSGSLRISNSSQVWSCDNILSEKSSTVNTGPFRVKLNKRNEWGSNVTNLKPTLFCLKKEM